MYVSQFVYLCICQHLGYFHVLTMESHSAQFTWQCKYLFDIMILLVDLLGNMAFFFAETSIVWPPHAKSWLTGKDSDAGRDWGQEEKGTTEDEMAGRHHQLNGHEFGWTPGVGDGQGGLACCNSWGCEGSDTTERLNWTELKPKVIWDNRAQSYCPNKENVLTKQQIVNNSVKNWPSKWRGGSQEK